MKHISTLLGSMASLFLCTGCGEDRSGEFYALINDKLWIEETMRENYLWQDEIPDITDDEYFTEPKSFFEKLLSKQALEGKGDKYSYFEETETESRSTLNRTSTYGFEFALYADPLGTTSHTFARILYVLPGSPASAAGLKRGDWLSAIDNERITTGNYTGLIQGGEVSLAREQIIQNEEGNTWQPVDTVSLGASRPMELNPFYVDTVYQIDGQKIAYLVYNQFSTGPNDEAGETEYGKQMKQIFARFRRQAPDAFILDLRYNPGGYLTCAQELSSLLAPASALGKEFVRLEMNSKHTPVSYALDPQYADANLDLRKLYVLVSANTASASEAVINGLIPYMGEENMVLIGEKTEGKNVAMASYQDDRFNFRIWPVVAYVRNAEGKSDYVNGMTPQYILNENKLLSPLRPLGDTQEYLLKNTLTLITTGTMPDATSAANEANDVRLLYTTFSEKKIRGTMIR